MMERELEGRGEEGSAEYPNGLLIFHSQRYLRTAAAAAAAAPLATVAVDESWRRKENATNNCITRGNWVS